MLNGVSNQFKPFSELSNEEKLRRARKDYNQAVSADSVFQRNARLANQFYAGDQYTREERSLLAQEGRPDLTCNLIKPTIELIKGVNEQNRVEVKANATEKTDGFLADILNNCYNKIKEIEDLEMQEDDALENCIITGRGFCAVDVAPDPKRPGEIKIPIVSIPPSEIRLDPSGKKNDLSDHRMIFWHKWVTLEDFAIQYPDAIEDIEAIMAGESIGDLMEADTDILNEFGDLPVDTPTEDEYSTIMNTGYYDKARGHVRVVHEEYWETYDRYYGFNPTTKKLEEFEKDKLKTLKQLFPNFQYQIVKDKKIKWFQFTGHKILYDGDSPIPYDGFSIVAEFAYKDKSRSNITHFGVVKDMIDPQREANKRWSQTLNLYLKQTQGGHFVEESAILDEKQWKDSINAPGEDTLVTNGALSEGKIREKTIPQFPTGALRLHEMAQDLIKKVSGVNPDLLGISGQRAEPGVVIRLRQQQGLTVLAKLFKNHHHMQEQLGKRIFAIIMKYMPNSQIQRILGTGDNYIFRGELIVDVQNKIVAPFRNLRDLKYNIDTNESSANTTKTMGQLAIFIEMMSKGFPVDPRAVVSRLDLPEKDKLQWIQYISQMQQGQQQQAQAELQLKAQTQQAKAMGAKERLQLNAQQAASELSMEQKELEQKELEDRRNFFLELSKLDMQSQQLVMGLITKLASQPMRLPASGMGKPNSEMMAASSEGM